MQGMGMAGMTGMRAPPGITGGKAPVPLRKFFGLDKSSIDQESLGGLCTTEAGVETQCSAHRKRIHHHVTTGRWMMI